MIVTVVLVVVGSVAASRVVRLALRPPAPPPVPVVPGPDPVNPAVAVQQGLRDLRPAGISFPGIRVVRGAVWTTLAAVTAWTRDKAGAEPLWLAGCEADARTVIDKLLFVTGKAGTAKSTLAKLVLMHVARLGFSGRLSPKFRLVVIDPTDSFWEVVHAVTPADVPIF